MISSEIEPGGVYITGAGSVREVVALFNHLVRYRYLKLGKTKGRKPVLGKVLVCGRASFAAMSVCEVDAW